MKLRESVIQSILLLAVGIALFFVMKGNVYPGELGSGAGSSYPNTMDTSTRNFNLYDRVMPALINDLNKAVTKIEVELGTKPAGGYPDVKARFDDIAKTTGVPKAYSDAVAISTTIEANTRAAEIALVWLSTPTYGSGGGGGGGTSSSTVVTLLIAANNALARLKAVADYVCDGTQDEVQISQAEKALTNGGVINFTEGTFTIDNNINLINSSITFRGAGKNVTFIKYKNSATGCGMEGYGMFMTTVSLTGVAFENLTFDGNNANNTDGKGCAIVLGVSPGTPDQFNWVVDNCRVKNFGYKGLYTYLCTCYDFIVRNSLFENIRNTDFSIGVPISIASSQRIRVYGNTCFNSSRFSSLSGGDITFENNTVRESYQAPVYFNGISTGTVSNNTVDGYTQEAGVYFASSSYNISIVGNTVNGHYATGGSPFCGMKFDNIYDSTVVGNTVMNCGSTTDSNGIYMPSTMTDVTIAGNTVGRCYEGICLGAGKKITITGNTCNSNTHFGFFIEGSSVTISGNTAWSNGSGSIYYTDTGIYGTGNSWNATKP